MEKTTKTKILLLTLTDGTREAHTTLTGIIETHPEINLNRHTIKSYITRAKVPYRDEQCSIEKIPLFKGTHKEK